MNSTTTAAQLHKRLVSPIARFAVAAVVGIAVGLALGAWHGGLHTCILAGWDAGVLVYLALAWALVWSFDAAATRIRVLRYDQSGYVIFVLVVTAAFASVFAVTWGLQQATHLQGGERALHVTLAVVALCGAWLLIHTVFAFHYARVYYRPRAGGDEHARGLHFPGGTEPDYLDFLYYACVIGMTSQVADVSVTTRTMRRLTLVHGVASFAFNLMILALAVNVVAGVI